MASRRMLIPLTGRDVAPRFDAALAVLLADLPDLPDLSDSSGAAVSTETIVLPRASADELCEFILTHGVTVVVANGIPEDHYHYLRWKRVEVIDDIMGSAQEAVRRYLAGTLQAGAILYHQETSLSDDDAPATGGEA
ncbi:MAG: dinitrogenase iron-molybdenum cofactor biosynthesis protein [Desulfovibrio sp.]|nr:dinitrogenase iron-molybdenum cofactor biosynthesis protein [Desulfovibrio sp.]MCA1984910.1 dinitrogenase iron-molybdenum cofactor biosynthesis protein [Desulfovibrio sp.]